MKQFPVLLGAIKYEFKMQLSRRSLWIVFIAFAALYFRNFLTDILHPELSGIISLPLTALTIQGMFLTNVLLPIPFGIFLADRLPRDGRTRVDELFMSMPGALSTRILGKYFGSVLATLVPMSITYAILTGFLLYYTHNIAALPLVLISFVVMVLPGLLFIAAFSIACPAILWVPLYQVLFIGYWFWGNDFSPANGIPTLSATMLTPIGSYTSTGILGVKVLSWIPNVTALQGIASILLLLSITVLVLYILWHYLRWQQVRQ